MSKTYYQILGVDKNSSADEIKKAYRQLAKKYHPDINKDPGAEERFKEIADAYEVIGDDGRRKQYDKRSKRPQFDWPFTGGQDSWGGMNMDDIMEDLKGTGFERNFEHIFGHQFNNNSARGKDVKLDLNITLEDVYYGTSKIINVSGNAFKINIEKGVSDGKRLRIKDRGHYHPLNSQAPRGDAIITIRLMDSKMFDRNGNDLHMNLDIPHLSAILGGSINIQVFDSKVELKIPELTTQGKVFRVKGKGMPLYKNINSYGDLYVKVNIITPDNISDDERLLYEKLKEIRNERV